MNTKIVCLLCLFLCSGTHAAQLNSHKSSLKQWLTGSIGEYLQISFNKQKIQFEGCKLKTYDLLLTKPIGDNFSIDMSIGYATGRNSWGIFSQTVLVKNYQITPRWHFNHFSIGVGLSMQKSHQLKTSHGPDINLPLQRQWSIEADLPALADNHSTRVSLILQQWQAEQVAYSLVDYNVENTALMINYSIVF